jgi:transcriptional regulator with XRE-family HTH domain
VEVDVTHMTSDPPDPGRPHRRRQLNKLRQWFKDHPETSQAKVAKTVGYASTMLSMVASGRRKISAEQVVKLAALTGISEHDLHLIFLNHRTHHRRKRGRRPKPS